MDTVKEGDKVKIHYTGRFEDGEVFDSSKDKDPLEFSVGEGNIIPGFEEGVKGMSVGETKELTLDPDQAYGQPRDELFVNVNKSDFPDHITPEEGQYLQIKQSDGNVVTVTVTDIGEETVTLDANHPLAGKTLIFDIEIVEIA
jgi:peptidylprolyl isomerase